MAKQNDVENFSKKEQADFLKLDDEIKRTELFNGFLKQYNSDFEKKCKKMNKVIDDNIDQLIKELNHRRKDLKQSLSDLQKNKKTQINSEMKSLDKYHKMVKQKASVCSNLMKESKKKNMDQKEREKAIHSIINSELDSAFEIYQDPFDIVSHFQSILTRPSVTFGNDENDSKNDSALSLENAQTYGVISEIAMKEFGAFLHDLPNEMVATQHFRDLMMNKAKQAESVFDHSTANITNLRMRDVNELYAISSASEELVLVFEAIYIVLDRVSQKEWSHWLANFGNSKKRKQRWNKLKSILAEPTFITTVFNYKYVNLTSSQLNILNNNYLSHSHFKYETVNKCNKTCGQLAHWIISLVRLANFNKQLKSANSDLKTQASENNKNLKQKQEQLKKQQKR